MFPDAKIAIVCRITIERTGILGRKVDFMTKKELRAAMKNGTSLFRRACRGVGAYLRPGERLPGFSAALARRFSARCPTSRRPVPRWRDGAPRSASSCRGSRASDAVLRLCARCRELCQRFRIAEPSVANGRAIRRTSTSSSFRGVAFTAGARHAAADIMTNHLSQSGFRVCESRRLLCASAGQNCPSNCTFYGLRCHQ